MARRGTLFVVVTLFTVVAWPEAAGALEQVEHQLITGDSCAAAGLPDGLCRRAAAVAHDVDAVEWSDLAAHAQSAPDEALCTGADATVARMLGLGQQFFDAVQLAKDQLGTPDSDDARAAAVAMATALGRALHTVQDDCAHRGMSNPEHAWLSREQTCTGAATNPDAAQTAIDCARTQTDAALAPIAPFLADAGVAPILDRWGCAASSYLDDPCTAEASPTMSAVCSWLGEAESWDGVDRQWDVAVVAPMLADAFVYGTVATPCDAAALAAPPATTVDVSDGPPICNDINLVCLGDGTSPNGWAPFGCRAAEGGSAPLGCLALLWALGLAARRRR